VDDRIEVRLPQLADAAGFDDDASQVVGLDGGSLPLSPGASFPAFEALVADWLREPSFHGPASAIVVKGLASEIELRLDSNHIASQWVAPKAGFLAAGTVVSE